MNNRALLVFCICLTVGALIIGCNIRDDDYKAGMYWLDEKDNWQMAAKAFKRSLDNYPDRWETHAMLIEALARGNDDLTMTTQLKSTLNLFPDSARSASIVTPASALLGAKNYDKLASSIELRYIGDKLAKQKNNTELLSRAVMASCRAQDTVAAVDYCKRLISSIDRGEIPDTVDLEMSFFLGRAHLEWIHHEYQVSKNPGDIEARLAQINAGILMGDSVRTLAKIKELFKLDPNILNNPQLVRRFSLIAGVDPFKSKIICDGWDAAIYPDGKHIVFIKNRGPRTEIDQYIMKAQINGRNQEALMKAVQHSLMFVSLPRPSLDGKWIFFYGSPDKRWRPGLVGSFNLYRIRPNYGAKPVKMTDANLVITPPFFANDGSLLLVRREAGSSRSSVEVIRLNPDSKEIEVLCRIGEPVVGASFNSSGDSLLFATSHGIFSRSIAGGKISVEYGWREMFFPELSPDDRSMIISNGSQQLLIIDRSTSEPAFLGTVASPFASFTRDGKLLITRFIDDRKQIELLNYHNTDFALDQLSKAQN